MIAATTAILIVLAGVTHAQNGTILLMNFTTGELIEVTNSTNSTGDEDGIMTPSPAPSTFFPTMMVSSPTSVTAAFNGTTTSNETATPTPSSVNGTMMPVMGGVANAVDTPTMAPFPTVALPPQAPQSRAPTNTSFLDDMASDFPTSAPSDVANATCSAYPSCANLTGECCPSIDGVFLACCGLASVEETCSLNSKCALGWGLTGSCCPTLSGEFLDCCDAVPDECLDDSSNCTVLSTRAYVESAASLQLAYQGSVLLVATTLGLVVVLLMA